MIDTHLRFRGHRILLESNPNFSEEMNIARARGYQRLIDEKILSPRSEKMDLDLVCLPEPEVAYDKVTCLKKRQK